jgi:predicted SAM-dependent methyltransferase
MSETAAARSLLADYCTGLGVDLGYGGSAIVRGALTFDKLQPYTKVGDDKQILKGDACDLGMFCDEALDYVYSSHLLEDFPPEQTVSIVREWMRVIKKGGVLVLLLPDEPVFREHCAKTGQSYNDAHRNHVLTLEWFKQNIVPKLGSVRIEFEKFPINIYSFAIVLKKM